MNLHLISSEHDAKKIVMEFLSCCSKEPNVDWLLRLFHSCNRVQKYAETEMVQVYLIRRKLHTGSELFYIYLRPWQTRTHCCRHIVADTNVSPFALMRNNCCGHKKCFGFVQKHFVSATNVSQFAQPKKHHKQQCVHNNVSLFAGAFTFYILFLACFMFRQLFPLVDIVLMKVCTPV